ncbi:MFS transporter [Enemella evansiae]|uniref:MFS transporter n=1 Tax=Enemella evansiae TaxID=2016499 RepID=UPI0010D5BA86|nr:aromatic acid/H+ symport family MFS transporter [Enemella evansiae]TDO92858.1 AAHS family benzoate transporter-like MFS transporter [Enemella evansiae]
MTAANTTQAATGTRTEGLTGNRLIGLVLICGLSITFDGYDLVVYGTTIPKLMAEWGIGPAQAGAIGSYSLIGMMIGALVIGSLADRVGRRKVLIASVAWFSLWMIVCAIAPSVTLFAVARFLCGLGLGACMPTAAAVVVEYAPRERSNFIYGMMQPGFAVGGILAALLGILVMPAFGWRAMYWIGALPLLIVCLPALKWLPESIEFLMAKGRRDQAYRLADRLGLVEPTTHDEGPGKVRLSRLFSGGLALPTVLFWVSTFCALLLVYGLNTWLPEIMRKQGYPLGSALSFLLVFNLGSILGLVVGATIADRIGSKPVIAVSFALAAISAVILSFNPNVIVLYLLVAIGGYGAIGTQTLINPFVTRYYPAALRTTGISWSLGTGRLGAICGPLLGGLVLASSLGAGWNFYLFAVVAVLGAIAAALVPKSPTPSAISEPSSEQHR